MRISYDVTVLIVAHGVLTFCARCLIMRSPNSQDPDTFIMVYEVL
jgi:hypothetical protein